MHPILLHFGPVLIPAYGVMAAVGMLLALAMSLRTARIAGVVPNHLWNLSIVALFAALIGSRLVLIVVNWTVLRSHPAWLLGLAMIHHPLLAAISASLALVAALVYARRVQVPLRDAADALAAPIALGLAFEQFGALLAGSGFGTETAARWAVVYTSPLAARWSGAPLGLPLHPVQLYAALAYLTLSLALLVWLPSRHQRGDVAGLGLAAAGVIVYFTEFLRDPEGRGILLHGALDGPQLAAILLLLVGAVLLRERHAARVPADALAAEASND
ncbi:MAG: prolipoprotein diacylglyceryl transferase family protein [Terracidiphilus sp.]